MTITKDVDISGWFLRTYLGDIARWWGDDEPFEFGGKSYTDFEEFKADYPALVGVQPAYYASDPEGGQETIMLDIDLETGNVHNWPKGVACEFYDRKIVDTGCYQVYDGEGNLVKGYTGYVPQCVGEGGYGDYLEFEVNEEGHIVDWDFDQEDWDEISKEVEDLA